jgi:hypothetical protein
MSTVKKTTKKTVAKKESASKTDEITPSAVKSESIKTIDSKDASSSASTYIPKEEKKESTKSASSNESKSKKGSSESIESTDYDDFDLEGLDAERQGIQMSKEAFTKIEVDLWKTEMHLANISLRQKDAYRAQSRQFTPGMKIIGSIEFSEGSKKSDQKEVITINDEFWNMDNPENDLANFAEKHKGEYDEKTWKTISRRLIIKTFTELQRDEDRKTTAGRFRAAMEESIVMSNALTFGEKKPRPYFFITIPGYDYRITLCRVFSFFQERYVFSLINPSTGELMTFRIEYKPFTPGNDYVVLNAETGERVGLIDEVWGNMGGKAIITLRTEPRFTELNRSSIFRRVLVLFAGLVHFLPDINAKYQLIYKLLHKKKQYVSELNKAEKSPNVQSQKEAVNSKYTQLMKNGQLIKALEVGRQELSLHFNPRGVRR